MRNKIAELEARIAELEAENKKLNEKKQIILRLDDSQSSVNNALLTLRTDIARSLKLRYDDYIWITEQPLSEEHYIFARVTLTQIFRALKRYGIELQSEHQAKRRACP